MIETLESIFHLLGYKWKIDGVLQRPSKDDLAQAIDRAKQLLYDEPVPSQLEVGRLIVRRSRPGVFEVYLYMGDTNE